MLIMIIFWMKLSFAKNCAFDILNDKIENVTLVQLMYSLGNANHAISIVGHWIFDSEYKKSIYFTQELLDIIHSPSIVFARL